MKRTPFMQLLWCTTQHLIYGEAVLRGIEGAWERVIAKRLTTYAIEGHPEAGDILESGDSDPLKAAYLITSSKIE